MTWSIQLTPWALPSLLAVLLVLRELGYLWPRRRELAAPALLSLSAASGVWALLHLVAVVTPALEVKTLLARAQYLPAAAAPVLWVWFAVEYAHRPEKMGRWPAVVLYAVSAVTALLALRASSGLLFHDATLADQGSAPLLGLVVRHGVWHWIHVSTRIVAVVSATALLSDRLGHAAEGRRRMVWAVVAALLALTPAAFQLSFGPGAEWADLSAAGFALGSAVLASGILHQHLLDLGPVARTLVMVELRDPIVVVDGKGRIVDANRAAEEILGLRPYGDVPVPLGTRWAASREEPGVSATIHLPVAGEIEERAFDVIVTPLGDKGTAKRSAMVLRDVTARERMERELRSAKAELEQLAKTDPLTGLANRRAFMTALHREVERAARYGPALSLVLLDLDHFKKVNDTWGHAAGDAVLKDAARALMSVCRELDMAARLGGEEMALLLPETDGGGALVVAKRLRARIEHARHTSPSGDPFQVTASVGVASLGSRAATGDALLQAADEALYAAKRGGRNRVVVSQ